MWNLSKMVTLLSLGLGLAAFPQAAGAADSDPFLNLLKQMDANICTTPKKITQFYSSKMVIMFDDKRILPETRIQDYEDMIADLVGLKCTARREVLASNIGDKVSYLLVDETIDVTSESGSTDERQHSVCTYGFSKEGGMWKISHEHCSSLPDYTIVPGDDALYYFHNPVY